MLILLTSHQKFYPNSLSQHPAPRFTFTEKTIQNQLALYMAGRTIIKILVLVSN